MTIQKVVTIAYALALGKCPFTRGEFTAFVEETGRKLGVGEHWSGKSFQVAPGTDLEEWLYGRDRSSSFALTARQPT